jgi:signal transduction histidine kinase
LLTNFLNFARPRLPSFQQTNLRALLRDVIQVAEHALSKRQIVFREQVDDDVRDVECDPDQLRQVLLNLLINAIEASPDGATVSLAMAAEKDKVVIRVVDEGCGVAPEHIEKLFDPFFTTKESGTGLGLPVAHQIVGQMGGHLSARRNGDRGMTFSIALPLKQHTAI